MVVPRRAPDTSPDEPVQFRRILCPVDFSDGSIRALTYAMTLARDTAAQLIVLHVIVVPPELQELPVSAAFRCRARAGRRRGGLPATTARVDSETGAERVHGRNLGPGGRRAPRDSEDRSRAQERFDRDGRARPRCCRPHGVRIEYGTRGPGGDLSGPGCACVVTRDHLTSARACDVRDHEAMSSERANRPLLPSRWLGIPEVGQGGSGGAPSMTVETWSHQFP